MRGFSLVELSIVLVILGLLTGGILAGQSLIRAAELRSVSSNIQRYHAAINTFKDKYMAVPGDMTNATAFWGSMTNCGVASPSGTGTQTCNGDGDGMIEAASAASRTGEMFAFWQHLANAALIEGSYTGIADASSTRGCTVGVNIPAEKISNVGYSIQYNVGGSYGIGNRNFIYIGTGAAGAPTWSPFLKAAEAWNVDTKVDDGRPGYGKIITSSAATDCVTSSTASTAEYALTSNIVGCSLYWSTDF